MNCPDGGSCHHECQAACLRVLLCGPLSGVFPEDEWPPGMRERARAAQNELNALICPMTTCGARPGERHTWACIARRAGWGDDVDEEARAAGMPGDGPYGGGGTS